MSDVERESNEPYEITQKAQKRKRAKAHLGSSTEDAVQHHSIVSSEGCLSFLKRAGLNGKIYIILVGMQFHLCFFKTIPLFITSVFIFSLP